MIEGSALNGWPIPAAKGKSRHGRASRCDPPERPVLLKRLEVETARNREILKKTRDNPGKIG